jgi:hypothetical protein
MAQSDARSYPVPIVIWIQRIATRVATLNNFGSGLSAQLLRSSLCVVTPLAQRRELIEVRKRLTTSFDRLAMVNSNCRLDLSVLQACLTQRIAL